MDESRAFSWVKFRKFWISSRVSGGELGEGLRNKSFMRGRRGGYVQRSEEEVGVGEDVV